MQHHYYCSAILKKTIPNIRRTLTTEKVFFRARDPTALVMGTVANGYYCTSSFGGRLDLLGWRALEYVRHYAESMRMMQAARREIGVSVCAFASSDRKIGHTVRITCVCVC